jgi:hypothetical protein
LTPADRRAKIRPALCPKLLTTKSFEVNCGAQNVDLRLWSEGHGQLAWLVSAGLHAAALVAVSAISHSKPQGAATEVTRESGIILVARQGGEAEYFADRDSHVVPTSFVAADSAPAMPPALFEPAVSTVPAPAFNQPVVAAAGLPTATPAAMNQSGAPLGRNSAPAAETRVFGVRGKGSRFVYVFDRSSSMEGAPLAAVKRELIGSLQSLQSVHQFQIIFYNEQPYVMPDFRGRSSAMVFADEPGKRLAANFVGSIFAHGATDHIQALRTALQMRPDVVFLLTDANEPQLRADELRLIRQLNPGTSINAIEFGIGPPAPRYNFLQQLAAENGGQHVYVDVTRLAR